MISEVVAALHKAVAARAGNDALSYAFHTGEAGGIAAALGLFGIKGLSLCDDISDAYETGDAGFMSAILAEAAERLETPDRGARVAASIGWPEYGAALHQAAKAKSGGDHLRDALMTGFVAGLLCHNPGPDYPDHGTIRDGVLKAYETGSAETLRWAQARIGSGVKMTDPTPFMGQEQYDRHYEERLRMMRWVQNFGLRQARAAEQRVAVSGSMRINHAVRRGAQPDSGSDGEPPDSHSAAARAPADAEYYISEGHSKRMRGDYDGAIADFDRAVELDPDHAGAYYIRGMIKEEQRDYAEAIADFDRAIALEPDAADMYNHRGYSKFALADYEGAIADFDRVLELEPGNEYAQRTRNSAANRSRDCG